jgi:hypothetical protein
MQTFNSQIKSEGQKPMGFAQWIEWSGGIKPMAGDDRSDEELLDNLDCTDIAGVEIRAMLQQIKERIAEDEINYDDAETEIAIRLDEIIHPLEN